MPIQKNRAFRFEIRVDFCFCLICGPLPSDYFFNLWVPQGTVLQSLLNLSSFIHIYGFYHDVGPDSPHKIPDRSTMGIPQALQILHICT